MVLGELSKALARTGGSRLVGSSSQVDILKSRGRLLYSKHPVGSKSSQRSLYGRLMQFYNPVYGYLSFEAKRYILVLDC